jgi:phosphoglycolate phosphatase-like HAD superfamily hydrolase
MHTGTIGLMLDFDGTVTKRKKYSGLGPFSQTWASKFSCHVKNKKLGLTWRRIEEWLADTRERIRKNPAHYAWLRGGFLASAANDEYMQAGVTGQEICDRYNHLLDLAEREAMLDEVYRSSYPHAEHELRPEAPDVLCELHRRKVDILIFTNSDSKKVARIITESTAHLQCPGKLDWILPKIVGDAQKANITPGKPPGITPTAYIEGLQRPVLLEREKPISVGRNFANGKNRCFAAGDNSELDLHWAEKILGYTTALVADEDTAGYERRHYENHQPDRYLLENSLEDLLTIVHS